MNVSVPDELIMAFADGELDGLLANRVRRAIRDDSEASRKHEIYFTTRHVFARVFDGILDEPLPERLTVVIANGRGPRSK